MTHYLSLCKTICFLHWSLPWVCHVHHRIPARVLCVPWFRQNSSHGFWEVSQESCELFNCKDPMIAHHLTQDALEVIDPQVLWVCKTLWYQITYPPSDCPINACSPNSSYLYTLLCILLNWSFNFQIKPNLHPRQ